MEGVEFVDDGGGIAVIFGGQHDAEVLCQRRAMKDDDADSRIFDNATTRNGMSGR